MKVLLINPPSDNELVGNNPPIIEEERGYNPPLGLLYIAAHLEKFSSHEVSVIDAQVDELDYPKLKKIIATESPDVVGITAMTFTLIDVIKTAELVKEVNPEIRVVLGGPHVHLYPDETIALPSVDYLVLGEGEIPFHDLMEHIDQQDKLTGITGLVFRHNGNVVNTGVRGLRDNLDEIPFPARHLTPYKKYTSLMAKRNPITTMFTSRGCPYKCIFCDRPHLGKLFRARSAGNVVDELEECVDLGIREFLIYDDTFTIQRKRVVAICEEILKRGLDIGWDVRARVNTVDEDLARLMKKAGCERIHYGVEAGTNRMLKVLQKGITVEEAHHAFRFTKKAGIATLAYFIIGSPTETYEDIKATMKLARDLNPDYVHITIMTPFPGTALYIQGLEEGVIERDFWREFAANPAPDFKPPYWEENFTRDELLKMIDEAYHNFYIRPIYIMKRVMQVRSWGQFKRHARAGLKVLKL
ncbi:MAG: B12-binding domain-containing radical SAM protein [Candidatus Eisenbacteria bacterium]|uniref:B12-binding domain-containing radical SAM protein n=1 Tax=Eiseniibacteriota bacterium TaxID=2212470 RepID=A0A948W7X7_UNCEI|nr:B12-binding domain-containing radical SAM protein [Candidatus Eisenbacteria bacterium]MBU1949816.1 B12-binding domain-containing radical SAM protein [Candidatus Eisenbacteria bacterium]MBU2692725.1 B12-binding domain-containing radical SAM protein [Candidatus Eisenbacteria bacterium]